MARGEALRGWVCAARHLALDRLPVYLTVGRDHGLLVHTAGWADDGLVVVNLWPSPDGSERAARDTRRAGVIQQQGLRPEQFRREHFDTIRYVVF